MIENNPNGEPACKAGYEIRARVTNLEESDGRQWMAIDRIQNRLPIWATVVISVLTCLLGASVTFAVLK